MTTVIIREDADMRGGGQVAEETQTPVFQLLAKKRQARDLACSGHSCEIPYTVWLVHSTG